MAKPNSKQIIAGLQSLGYDFRMNAMDETIEVNGEPLSEGLRATIFTRMNDNGFTSNTYIEQVWTTLAYKHQYHPICEYLDNLKGKWGGQDHIGDLMRNYLIVDNSYFDNGTNWGERFVRRWMIGAVAKVYQRTQNFCLTLDGRQDLGKSTFVRWLASPLAEYHSEAPFKAADNDSRLRKMRTWIWELGELQFTTRRSDREALKHEISEMITIARRPYARQDTRKPNITSFVGTINDTGNGFLNDPTGSRRFVTVKLQDIDWEGYTQDLSPDDIWAQAVALFVGGEPWRLSPDESRKQREFNRGYEASSPLEEMFYANYEIVTDGSGPKAQQWIASMEIIAELELQGLKGSQRGNLMQLAELMTKEGVRKERRELKVNIPGQKPKTKKATAYQGVARI